MDVRGALRRVLRIGGGLAVVLAAALACWGWLAAMGDRHGAEGVRGVVCVTSVLLGLDLIAMIVVLALAELKRPTA